MRAANPHGGGGDQQVAGQPEGGRGGSLRDTLHLLTRGSYLMVLADPPLTGTNRTRCLGDK